MSWFVPVYGGGGGGSSYSGTPNYIPFAGPAGDLTESSDFQWNDSTKVLTVNGTITGALFPATGISGLTATRIPFGAAGGGLEDSADLTWDGGLSIALNTGLSLKGIEITEDDVARSAAMVNLWAQPSRTADVFKIDNQATAVNVDGIAITQWGGGHALHVWLGMAYTQSALRVTEGGGGYVGARTAPMLDLQAEQYRTGHVISIDNDATATANSIYVDHEGSAAAVYVDAAAAGGYAVWLQDGDLGGTRGWMADFSGDSVVGTSGEHIYSDQDDRLRIYCGGETEFFTDTARVLGINATMSTFYQALTMRDNMRIFFGNLPDASMGWTASQTPDSFFIGVGAENNGLIICETGDITYDFAHALQANPTIWLQSANQSATEWLSLAHDQTNGVIATGAGDLTLSPAGNVNVGANNITGTRGWMADFSGDSVVGTSGEHIWSDADDSIQIHSGSTIQHYQNTTLRASFAGAATFYQSITVRDNYQVRYGSGNDSTIGWRTDQTPDSLVWGLSGSNAVTICEVADVTTDFAHSATDPTLFIQSADATDVTEFLSLAWNKVSAKRGWMLDLSGDSVVGTSGEHIYSTGDNEITIWCGGSRSAMINTSYFNSDRTIRPSANNTKDLGATPSNHWRSGYFATSVTGTRGWMLDLSGDSVVGTSGEHIYSSADDYLRFQAGGRFDWYHDGTIAAYMTSNATYLYTTLTLRADHELTIGQTNGGKLQFDTGQTVDGLVFGLGTASRSLVFCEVADIATDWGHAQQTNPTTYWQAADATDITKWGSLAHDQTDFVIGAGAGSGVHVKPTLQDGGTPAPGFTVTTAAHTSLAQAAYNGIYLDINNIVEFDDSSTVPTAYGVHITRPRFQAETGTGITISLSAALYIAGPPTTGTETVTFTSNWAIYVERGDSFFGGHIQSSGVLYLDERAAAATDVADHGQLWVRSSDGLLCYTDADGVDYTVDLTAI